MIQLQGRIFNVRSPIGGTLVAVCVLLSAGAGVHANLRDPGSPTSETAGRSDRQNHVLARVQIDKLPDLEIGGIHGRVSERGSDAAGIVDADITIRSEGGTLLTRLKSGPNGYYAYLLEPPLGLYRVTVEKSGFQTTTKSFLNDGPGVDTLDFQLSRQVVSPPTPPVAPSPTLSLNISAPKSHESLPLVLRFELGTGGGTEATGADLTPLELRYRVTAGFGPDGAYEDGPFFSDVVHLSGEEGTPAAALRYRVPAAGRKLGAGVS